MGFELLGGARGPTMCFQAAIPLTLEEVAKVKLWNEMIPSDESVGVAVSI